MEQDRTTTTNYDLYECRICHRNFLTLWCLQLHEKFHNNAVQWCEECGTRFTCFSDLYQHLPVHISGETLPRLDGKSDVDDETGNSDLEVETDQFRTERDHETERGKIDQFVTERDCGTERGEVDQFGTERIYETQNGETDQLRKGRDHETEKGETDQLRTERVLETKREQTDQLQTECVHETEREETDQLRTERVLETKRKQTDQLQTECVHETERGETDQLRTEHVLETKRKQTDQLRTECVHETEREETDQLLTDCDHETEREETDQLLTDCDHGVEREQSGSDNIPDLTDGSGKYGGPWSDPNKAGTNVSDRQIDANVAQNDSNNTEENVQLNSSSNGGRTMSCPKCNKSFSYKTILMLHLRKHKKKTPYKCQICGLGFISWNAYKLHRKSYGNMPHKKSYTCKPVEKVSALPVGYCSKMFPPSRRFQKANSSLVTGTSVEEKDGGDSGSASKYSGWFLCLICGTKVRGKRGSLAHHKLFHLGHELRNVKTSRVPGLQRPWLKCSRCNKKMRSRTNLDIHEARCDKGKESTEESSEKVEVPENASSAFPSRGRGKFPRFDSELRSLSSRHGPTGPWRQCLLCSTRCRGWHQFNRHLEVKHTETYRRINTESESTSTISDSSKGMSRPRPRNIKYALSFTKCTDNMQCSWYSCSNCKRKFQGRESMKRHYTACSRIAEICGTGNTVLKGTVMWNRKNWCKTSQKKNCSMYRCRFCDAEFKGRRRVVEHVRHCSKKWEHSGTFPAGSGEVKSRDWLPSQSESNAQSEGQQPGHSSDNPGQLFCGTVTICSKCGTSCKGSIELCAHNKTCVGSETRKDHRTSEDTEVNDALTPSTFWRYGCWYCCRICKEKCRGYQQMINHVCPPASNFERFQSNWYRCRSCGQSCRNHHGMRDHVCPLPDESSGEVGSQPASGPKPDTARHSSQYCAALYGFEQNGSWFKCNVCGQNCMGKWSLEKHTHDEASSSRVMSDFCKNGTWYWCKVCKMRLRGEKGLKSHVHAGSKCSTDEEEQCVVMGGHGGNEVKAEQGMPETGNECKEVVEELPPVLVNGDNADDGQDSKLQSDGEQGEYFGWTVITEFSDDVHL